ncbi:helix-turn-helix domain-containing protein [Streptomyces botrytidirepellens]|uniref:XRE family transcriptional regulator n=1 Tax=Streptomyces botrytidirepellens TaxID=2486417 RepID=A0A3M8VYK7_9ACTN|nr:helix-turn-helix domain-containing protein [Streptomyces botrytidirepellens]RNG21609.1 XRE family transcriptional regulator [Streptomyces botrytidirepellens]
MDEFAFAMRGKRLQDFLKGRREYLGLSQEVVAERLNISARAYGNWERGRVKEWTDQKLYALAETLEMTTYQVDRLFRIAVDRAPQSNQQVTAFRGRSEDPSTTAFLGDYRTMMDALSLPTYVVDHRGDVKIENKAYRDLFSGVRPHGQAMPSRSFLRFGLFHPEAPAILAGHANWQLVLLAQLASKLDSNSEDPELQSIRREVLRNESLRKAYLHELPYWTLSSGADPMHHEGALLELHHPDHRIGVKACRLVEETPKSLERLGLTRITLVLTNITESHAPQHGIHERGLARSRHAA